MRSIERLFVWARLLDSLSLWVIEEYHIWGACFDESNAFQALLTSPGHARLLVSIHSIDDARYHHIFYNAAHPENHCALHLSNVAKQLHELFALEHILFDDWAPVLLDYLYRGTTPDRATAVDLDFLRSQHS